MNSQAVFVYDELSLLQPSKIFPVPYRREHEPQKVSSRKSCSVAQDSSAKRLDHTASELRESIFSVPSPP